MSMTADNCNDWQIGRPNPAPVAPLIVNPQPSWYPVYPWVPVVYPQPQTVSLLPVPDVSALEARIADLEKQVARLKSAHRPRRRRI